jgi:putative PIN family toxin of toxin-antitoxin system
VRRVSLDTNVLAPGFTSRAGALYRLLELWRAGAFELILSEHILQEITRTLTDSYYVSRFSPVDAAVSLALLKANATMVELTIQVRGVATHPEDDLILSTALSGQSSILCTRDKQLLRLRGYQDLMIMSPGELLALLEEEVTT